METKFFKSNIITRITTHKLCIKEERIKERDEETILISREYLPKLFLYVLLSPNILLNILLKSKIFISVHFNNLLF